MDMQVNRHALRVIRERSGLGLSELARRAGCSQPHLSNIEHGRRHPSPATLHRLAAALHVPVVALLAEDGAAPEAEEADDDEDGVGTATGGRPPDQRVLSRNRSTSTMTRVTRPTATSPRSSSTDTVKMTLRPATFSTVAVAVTE